MRGRGGGTAQKFSYRIPATKGVRCEQALLRSVVFTCGTNKEEKTQVAILQRASMTRTKKQASAGSIPTPPDGMRVTIY